LRLFFQEKRRAKENIGVDSLQLDFIPNLTAVMQVLVRDIKKKVVILI
jgi:hypothetical protein